jgi:hypothetical protein
MKYVHKPFVKIEFNLTPVGMLSAVNQNRHWRMSSSGMWRRVYLLWTDVSEECVASIFRVEKRCFRLVAQPASNLPTLVPRSRIFLAWRWRWHVPQKRRFTQDLHGATSQKTAFFIVYSCENLNSYTIDIIISFLQIRGRSICCYRVEALFLFSELLNSLTSSIF